jgi:hypothetical protein
MEKMMQAQASYDLFFSGVVDAMANTILDKRNLPEMTQPYWKDSLNVEQLVIVIAGMCMLQRHIDTSGYGLPCYHGLCRHVSY